MYGSVEQAFVGPGGTSLKSAAKEARGPATPSLFSLLQFEIKATGYLFRMLVTAIDVKYILPKK